MMRVLQHDDDCPAVAARPKPCACKPIESFVRVVTPAQAKLAQEKAARARNRRRS